MPPRPKIALLPKEIREQLDQKLVDNAFSNYAGLSAWLGQQGYSISLHAVHRHGSALERKIEAVKRATEMAKTIVEDSPDDEGAMNDALIRLVQQIDFEILVELEQARDGNLKPQTLAAITRSVAALAQASVRQKKWQIELREKVASQIKAAEEKIAAVAKTNGLSADAHQRIRNALMDIDPAAD